MPVGMSLGQTGGLVLASAAIASLAIEGGWRGTRDPRPFLFGLVTAAFISAYTIIDGLGVRRSGSALGFIAWLFAVDGIPLTVYALVARPGRIVAYVRAHWKPGLVGGLMCALAYGLVIRALRLGAMATISARRETSVIFAAAIGWLALGEPFGRRRIAAAAVAAGIVLMSLPG